MSSHFKAIYPIKYYEEHLNKNIRLDGRRFEDFLPFEFSVNSIRSTKGSSIIKLGNTTIVCGIRAELTKPLLDSPNAGILTLNADFPQICSPKFRLSSNNKFGQIVSNQLMEIITKSKCFDLAQLLIFSNISCWNLICDFVCLDFDGSIMDALIMSFITAIKSTKLPTVSYSTETKKAIISDSNFIDLRLSSFPFAITFVIFNNKTLLVEPTEEEENLSQNKLVFVANLKNCNEIFSIEKLGGQAIDDTIYDKCFELMEKRASHLCVNLNSQLSLF